jgi:thiamine pyrophosphate-dependent acetolactate synthase large subunit-like protein
MYSSSRRRFVRNLSLAVSAVPLAGQSLDLATANVDSTPKEAVAAVPADTTADVIVDKLISWGVQLVFGLTGDGIIPLVEALRKRQDKIRYITVRHEETAAFMASGYAKYTGKLGVCLATTGPGAVHLLNGLYDAAMEGASVLAITGIINHDLLGTQFTQEVDTIKMLQDVAIYNQTITGAQHALTVVDLACRNALTVPGVAHIAISTDTQMKPLAEDKASKKAGHLTGSSTFLPRRDVPDGDELSTAAALLNKPGKIMILAGRGALDARDELIQLAEKLGAPVAKALLGKAVLPDNSPYTTGGTGRLGTIPSKQMMEECDTLLIVGSTMPHLEYYPKKAVGIQIDRDARRIGLRYPVALGVHGDVRATLRALLPMLDRHGDRSFLELAQSRMKTWRTTLTRLENGQARPIHPAFLAATVGRLLADDAVVSIDTGAHTVFTARHWPIRPSQQLAVCGNLASMAPGLPYALAASLAFPGRQCVAMAGDGSLTMLMGELATAVMYGLNVKVVVFKNDILAMDKFEQEEAGAQDYGVKLQPIDFVRVAEACGAEGYACKDPGQLESVIRRAFASSRAAVIEVEVDPNAEPFAPEKITV